MKASDRPALVSVIMPVFNAEKTLRRSIDSVLQQTCAALELIIVDDASVDSSLQIVDEYAVRDARIRVLRQAANAGVAAARNAGIAAASGTHIAFLDSDDWWQPRKLELQLEQMRESGVKVSYTAYLRVAEDGRVLAKVTPPAAVSYADMLRGNPIGLLTGMYERSLGDPQFGRIGHEDYVFWLDLVKRAGGAICIRAEEPLAFYLVRGGSISANKLRAARWQWHIYRRIEGLGVVESIAYMMHYVAGALRKRR